MTTNRKNSFARSRLGSVLCLLIVGAAAVALAKVAVAVGMDEGDRGGVRWRNTTRVAS